MWIVDTALEERQASRLGDLHIVRVRDRIEVIAVIGESCAR